MTEPDARLKNWFFLTLGKSRFLVGEIFDDKKERFADNTRVRTSQVKKVEEGLAYTLNSVYVIDPKDEYKLDFVKG